MLGAPRPHYIFMSSNFQTIPFPGKGNNHQKPTAKTVSLFGPQFVSMVFAVPYREWLVCVNIPYSSSTPFGGDGTLNQHRSMQCLPSFYLFHWMLDSGLLDVIHCISFSSFSFLQKISVPHRVVLFVYIFLQDSQMHPSEEILSI